MVEINFYRGLAENYNREIHGDGIYFATNTLQIIHDGKSYGMSSQVDLDGDYATTDFIADSLLDFMKNLQFNQETGEFSYTKRKKVFTKNTDEFGDEVIDVTYEDVPVKFSFRSVLAGTVKNISFEHSEDGSGVIAYSQLYEKTEVLDTGVEITTLDEKITRVELPTADYTSGSYLDGLMSGEDKETLDKVNDALYWKSPNI